MDNIIDITICVDNDAFGIDYADQAQEVSRILQSMAQRIEEDPDLLDPTKCAGFSASDRNGNRVAICTAKRIWKWLSIALCQL